MGFILVWQRITFHGSILDSKVTLISVIAMYNVMCTHAQADYFCMTLSQKTFNSSCTWTVYHEKSFKDKKKLEKGCLEVHLWQLLSIKIALPRIQGMNQILVQQVKLPKHSHLIKGKKIEHVLTLNNKLFRVCSGI